MLIKSLKDIDFQSGETIEIEGSIVNLLSEGNEDRKQPIRFQVMLENGEVINIACWAYPILDNLKSHTGAYDLFQFSGKASEYNGSKQIKIFNGTDITDLNKKAINKPKELNPEDYIKETGKYIEMIKDESLKKLVKTLLRDNISFFEWVAARSIHHNYRCGLAIHSLEVCQLSLNSDIWNEYNKDLLIAGSLLHDIGKIKSYTEDSLNISMTDEGRLLGHIPIGYEMVSEAIKSLNLENNKQCLLLKHCILAHHELLEYGAAVNPVIPEALIIARADKLSADLEAIRSQLRFIPAGNWSEPVRSVNNVSFLKE